MNTVASSALRDRVATTATDRTFFSRMAYACAAVGVIGFAPTFWIPLLTGRLTLPPILYLHAAVFYSWLALFVFQSRLVATRQLSRHRTMGVVGVALMTAMCFVGTLAAVSSMRAAGAAGFATEARAFSVVPLMGIAVFATLFVIAVLNVSRPDVHKRLLLVATVSLLNAAVGRLFILALGLPSPAASVEPPPVYVSILPGLIADGLLIPALLYDRRHLGSVHRVYWVAGGALIASQVLRVPFAATGIWQSIAAGVNVLMP
jgi:hypothetical protein